MPAASEELANLIIKWFGSISDRGPYKFLHSHGFRLTEHYLWVKPSRSYTLSDDEWYCLKFLVDEWDFGGLVASNDPVYDFKPSV